MYVSLVYMYVVQRTFQQHSPLLRFPPSHRVSRISTFQIQICRPPSASRISSYVERFLGKVPAFNILPVLLCYIVTLFVCFLTRIISIHFYCKFNFISLIQSLLTIIYHSGWYNIQKTLLLVPWNFPLIVSYDLHRKNGSDEKF